MAKVIPHLFGPLRKLKLSRVGFTLVELLVVIGIIAILAGVALGPITQGIKKANQSKGLQTAHVIALAEFQFANDNNSDYPDTGYTAAQSAVGASAVANCLINGGYISDPTIFWISGSTTESKFTGTLTSGAANLPVANISWDFCGAGGNGVNPNAPDQLPLVWSSNHNVTSSVLQTAITTPAAVTVSSSNPFGTGGMAVCYKSNSASFLVATASGANGSLSTMFPAGYPGWSVAVPLQGNN